MMTVRSSESPKGLLVWKILHLSMYIFNECKYIILGNFYQWCTLTYKFYISGKTGRLSLKLTGKFAILQKNYRLTRKLMHI